MKKEAYLKQIEKSAKAVLDDPIFINFKKQIFAWRLKAEFNRSYDEEFLWNRALFLSTNASILLDENSFNPLAIKILKECAEIYEYLHEVSEKFDKSYCGILAAICYDISGYQANALCLISKITNYKFVGETNYLLSIDNFILEHIKQILFKKISYANNLSYKSKKNEGILYFEEFIKLFYNNILYGLKGDFNKALTNSYSYFLIKGNTHISHLLFLLRSRINQYEKRSIWNILGDLEKTKSDTWIKYIKLLTNDIYNKNNIKNISERTSKFEFWNSQINAIKKGILSINESFVIQMPTSSGKTFIAELTILDNLIKNPSKKCIYIAPFKALVNEIDEELSKNLSKIGYSVSTLLGSYETDEFQETILNETDVLIATPEKVEMLLRNSPSFFSDVSTLVMDEGHIIGSKFNTSRPISRSATIEFLITKLKLKIPSLKIIFISAVMPELNAEEFSKWISSKKDNVLYSPKDIDGVRWKPTRQVTSIFSWTSAGKGRLDFLNIDSLEGNKFEAFAPNIIESKKFTFINPKTKKQNNKIFPDKDNKSETAAALAYYFVKEGNCLIFCSTPRSTESVGKNLLKYNDLLKNSNEVINSEIKEEQNLESIFLASKWMGENSLIVECLKKNIGIHNANVPDPVRDAIEKDYRAGKLKILIATNTLVQGINLPLKNIVIHSLVSDYRRTHYNQLSSNDFWNLVGRAGRAGKETEGKIIFIDSPERNIFMELLNKKNLEPSKSAVYQILEDLIEKRVGQDKIGNYLSYLFEPFILNILFEEIIGTEDEEIIKKIIKNSLFGVQVIGKNLEVVKKSLKNTLSLVRKEVTDNELGKIFSRTGFTLYGNKKIYGYIEKNLEELKKIIKNKNERELLKHILDLFRNEIIPEMKTTMDISSINENDLLEIILSWMNGNSVDEIMVLWNKSTKIKWSKFFSECLSFLYPWGISAFLIILSKQLGIDQNNLPRRIKNLPTFIKFGLNEEFACFAISLGIKNRESALVLMDKCPKITEFKEFITWLSNITHEEIKSWGLENSFDEENILSVAIKLNFSKHKKEENFRFFIKGIFYEENRKKTSKLVKAGDILTLKRDEKNKYDPFAIKIYYQNQMLGYIPREYSRIIATEIDLDYQKYQLQVIEIEERSDLNIIKIALKKVL